METNPVSVDPLTLRYKGKRLFQPAHMLAEDLRSSPDYLLQQLALAAIDKPVKCIPVLQTIMELCKDVAGTLAVDSAGEEFPEFSVVTQFQRLDTAPDFDTKMVASAGGAHGHPLHILSAAEIQSERWLVHTDRPMFFPNDESPDAVALKIKLMLACNRVMGIQSFVVVMPYIAMFSIPHLWTNRGEQARNELSVVMRRVFREDYEIRLREEHREKRTSK